MNLVPGFRICPLNPFCLSPFPSSSVLALFMYSLPCSTKQQLYLHILKTISLSKECLPVLNISSKSLFVAQWLWLHHVHSLMWQVFFWLRICGHGSPSHLWSTWSESEFGFSALIKTEGCYLKSGSRCWRVIVLKCFGCSVIYKYKFHINTMFLYAFQNLLILRGYAMYNLERYECTQKLYDLVEVVGLCR